MNDRRKLTLFTVLLPLALVLAAGNLLYSTVTGGSIGSDVHYDIFGRALNGVLGIGFIVWGGRAWWRIVRAERSARRDEHGE